MNHSSSTPPEVSIQAQMAGHLKAFARNNGARARLLPSLGCPNHAEAFRWVPWLLQANHPGLPGFIDADDVPRGILGFRPERIPEALPDFLSPFRNEWPRIMSVRTPAVQSLFLIGSAGTVGQTQGSDLDYWLALDRTALTSGQDAALRAKLDAITAFARQSRSVEVNFYPMDLGDLAANRVPSTGGETEGEVAPLMLKEELYRTLFHVAGRRPLWWAAPPGLTEDQYQTLARNLRKVSPEAATSLIDLGFPRRPEPQEYMAAALWLSRKSEDDPFKAALKMVLILEQVLSGLAAPLLCDQFKQAVLTAPADGPPVDPYALTVQRAAGLGSDRLDEPLMDLVRTGAYLKIRGPMTRAGHREESIKAALLAGLKNTWGWTEEKAQWLDQYSQWTDRERLALGERMKNLLLDLYKRIASRLIEDYPDRINAGDHSLLEFKARALSRYSDHEASVERLPSSLDQRSLSKSLSLVYNPPDWGVYSGRVESFQAGGESAEGQLLYRASQAARTAAWLVLNGLFDERLELKIRSRPIPLGKEDYLELLGALARLFPPMDFKDLEDQKGWRQGAVGPRLLVLNFESGGNERGLRTVDFFFRTAFGEWRHIPLSFGGNESEAEKYRAVADRLLAEGSPQAEDIHLFAPAGPAGKKIRANLQAALAQGLGLTRSRSKKELAPGTKVWLDTE